MRWLLVIFPFPRLTNSIQYWKGFAVIQHRSNDYVVSLVHELQRLSGEAEWVEFKKDRFLPEDLGEYISSLSNSAALIGKLSAFMVWGIDDSTHEVVGTTFSPTTTKVSNEELESWLLRLLSPKINFFFYTVEIQDQKIVVLEIEAATRHPVQFKGNEFIRVGSYKKRLKDFPEKERALWRIFDKVSFEDSIAEERLTNDEVLRKLEFSAYFNLLQTPVPTTVDAILSALVADELISVCDAGGFNITNLGAILFAKRLTDFPSLSRKAVRVVLYKGTNRVETVKELMGAKGYAADFESLLAFVNAVVPSNELILQALRRETPMYPALAVRELIANALIHQDFYISGSGPMIEIFADRMEITNPGIPLVDTKRFLDTPPRSRNESLASLMRRLGICEERGSGVDKVVFQAELFQLPAPVFEVSDEATRAVLFAHRPLTKMDKGDRVWACYMHACLKYVGRDYLTNGSLRERFGVETKNSATVSRFIKEAVDGGVIAPYDPSAAPKLMKYVPWWADPNRVTV